MKTGMREKRQAREAVKFTSDTVAMDTLYDSHVQTLYRTVIHYQECN